MNVFIGAIDDDFKIQIVHVNKGKGETHDKYGIIGDHSFRVVENVIYWWNDIPNADIKETVMNKLRKKTRFTAFSHKLLSVKMLSYAERFFVSHGYEYFN